MRLRDPGGLRTENAFAKVQGVPVLERVGGFRSQEDIWWFGGGFSPQTPCHRAGASLGEPTEGRREEPRGSIQMNS